MCSIIGFYKLNKNKSPQNNFIKNGFDLMRHRGPDGEDFKEFDNLVGLGNQRLAIIDIRKVANQPMETKKSAIVFNGEIYNYLELKKTFSKKNRFKTGSDTEVLQKGLEKESISFLNKTNGMFAFAFFDKSQKKLVLARDRFGIKPLYYLIQNDILYFSSEMKPLINIKNKLEKNFNVYDNFVKYSATDYNEETFIKDIFQVKKGHCLVCKNSKFLNKQWYFGNDYNFDTSVFKNKKRTINLTEELLTDAISLRLRADVPLCITLSGGTDSTTIYTLIKEKLKFNIKPFTFIHPGSETNEQEKVEKLTSFYNDTVYCIRSDYKKGIKDIKEALDYLEFPIWNPSAIAYMDTYKKISKNGFKVVIEGHGGDEQLGGYPYMIKDAVFELIKKKKFLKAAALLKIFRQTANPGLSQKASFSKVVFSVLKQIVKGKVSDVNFQESIEEAFNFRILPIVLRAFDRLTMRSSVESRCPFMDYRLVEFFNKMPLKYKVSSLGSKAILREILKKYKKDFIYKNRSKMGFAADLPAFFKDRKTKDYFKECIYKFKEKRYKDLKKKALKSIKKDKIDWKDTGSIWKIASLFMINKKYGL